MADIRDLQVTIVNLDQEDDINDHIQGQVEIVKQSQVGTNDHIRDQVTIINPDQEDDTKDQIQDQVGIILDHILQ